MVRGPRKHLKRWNAPKHWMLSKLGGTWAPRPSEGPHKLRECLPLLILLRDRLKYALTRREVLIIVNSKHIKVDGKVRTDPNFPAGFQDVVDIKETGEHFRLLYDSKGRFIAQTISPEEATWKLLRVKKLRRGAPNIPILSTHDGRTIRFPDPDYRPHDSVKYDIASGNLTDHLKFEVGATAMITGGRNVGRVGVIESRERHEGSFDIIYLKDSAGHPFSTRLENVFVIGKKGKPPVITLPPKAGVKLSIIEERDLRFKRALAAATQSTHVKHRKAAQ